MIEFASYRRAPRERAEELRAGRAPGNSCAGPATRMLPARPAGEGFPSARAGHVPPPAGPWRPAGTHGGRRTGR
ncbi:hypothetical protein SAMN05216223_125119 [Actinacidiphila yanglinensis]|uniref:Uncharacterized protein n=1 Tax=Actinacidiphila yanglinensis TaxID=310779 RepID=A0A1H6E5N6_9ACTN|nr:hypothetical protein [Actinacidiphila yanglinensis]SEG92294.1 hypothetical protein SAMN05216223_125119 [Actinacidiphila yanglinensis]